MAVRRRPAHRAAPTGARLATTTLLALCALAAVASAGTPATATVPRVIGGTPAAPGSWASAAFIYDEVGKEVALCTGTVIAADVVLTAAHCVENPVSGVHDAVGGFHVVTGAINWRSPSRQLSTVREIFVHRTTAARGANQNVIGDAALLVLETPTTAPAIALADSSGAALTAPGTRAAIAGWGRTDPSVPNPPDVLQVGATTIQPAAICASFEPAFDARAQLCAVDSPSYADATCSGDSGGPLVVDANGTPVEVALVSTGGATCATTAATYFTRIDFIYSWVKSSLASLTSAPPTSLTTTGYSGLSSQHRQISVVLSRSRRRLISLRVGLRLACRGGAHDILTARWFSRRHPLRIPANGHVHTTLVTRAGRDFHPGRYSLHLAVTATAVTGTIGGAQRAKLAAYGRCHAEHVNFTLHP